MYTYIHAYTHTFIRTSKRTRLDSQNTYTKSFQCHLTSTSDILNSVSLEFMTFRIVWLANYVLNAHVRTHAFTHTHAHTQPYIYDIWRRSAYYFCTSRSMWLRDFSIRFMDILHLVSAWIKVAEISSESLIWLGTMCRRSPCASLLLIVSCIHNYPCVVHGYLQFMKLKVLLKMYSDYCHRQKVKQMIRLLAYWLLTSTIRETAPSTTNRMKSYKE